MEGTTAIIITLIALTLSAFFSGMEIAFVSSSRVRASIDATKGGFGNKIRNIFYNNSDMVISTLLIGNNIVLVVYSMGMVILLEPLIAEYISANTVVVLMTQTLISTLIIIFLGEFMPKMLFRINPNSSLKAGSLPLIIFYTILYPISWFASFISKSLMKIFGINSVNSRISGLSVSELDAYIQENIDKNEDENKVVEHEVKIFHNALDFSDTHLRDCMIPRNEIVAVDIDKTNREKLVKIFTETGLSKLVVYRDEIDNIVGYIHVNELFKKNNNWKEKIIPVLYAPETMLANKMMKSLTGQNKSIAIVIDEFGGTAGMVTLEDLVEEIFGDFEDEHDHKRIMSRIVAPGVYEFAGRAEIEKINERYHLDLREDDEYQTIAGYLLFNLEIIPNENESFVIDGKRFTIIRKSASKIEVVRVETLDEKEP